jgi:branched-chain amino acid aminotransferase
MVFATPVGPYFKHGLKPIKLLVEEEVDRAAPNGVGDVKVGGNYAAGLRASFGAKGKGYDEALYLDALEKQYIDESGATNFFGITKDGKYVTPSSHSILPSITNMSLRTIAKDLGITVEDRPIHVDELSDFVEVGCCGTAAIITPVKSITYRGKDITYDCGADDIGPVSKKIYDKLTGIQCVDV